MFFSDFFMFFLFSCFFCKPFHLALDQRHLAVQTLRNNNSIRFSSMSSQTPNTELHFDVETAIKVCRQAGYNQHALQLAEKQQKHKW